MATIAVLEAWLRADTRDFDRSMSRSETGMQKASRGIHRAAFAIGAAVATGLGVAAKVGWDELREGQQVAAQTGAVLKSTGGVANVTARHVDDLATSIMKKSGIDDEAVKSGENMLLTFTNIRNEVGKGNDIFDQSTSILADMSVALGTDMSKQAIQLGKALNDPVRGLTALRRVGVSFTDAQEKQIKRMVESGRTIDAQKLILRELNKEFGGSAEAAGKTLPGQLNILRETFANFAGELVAGAIPRIKQVIDLIREHSTLAKVAAGIIVGLAAGIVLVSAALKVYRAGVVVATAVQWLWNAAMTANPIGLIIVGLVALGVALVIAYKKFDKFRAVVDAVASFVKDHWKIMLSVLTGGLGAAVIQIIEHWGDIKRTAKRLGDWFTGTFVHFFKDAWQAVTDAFFNAKNWMLRTFLDFALKFLRLADKAFGWLPGLGPKIDKAIEKINEMKEAAELAAARRYAIRFVTNAGRVKSDIEDLRGTLPGRTGDIRYLDIAPSRSLGSVNARLFGALGLAQQMGLGVTSTYRPGATVAGSGVRSDHSYFPSKAVDFSGPSSVMARFARAVTHLAGIDTVIYSPVGLYKAGYGWGTIRSAQTRRDHYDHVHVDTFDRGGWLRPGWTLAGNFTGRPERVGGAVTNNFYAPNYLGREETLMDSFRRMVSDYERRNGRSPF